MSLACREATVKRIQEATCPRAQGIRGDGIRHVGNIPDLGSCRRGEARTEVRRFGGRRGLEAQPAALPGAPYKALLWGMVPTLGE